VWRGVVIVGMILLIVLGVPVGIWCYCDATWGRLLDEELAAIRAAGAPITLMEAVPLPPPDDQNAAMVYQEVFRVTFDPEAPPPTAPLPLTDLTEALEYDDHNDVVLDAKARALLVSAKAEEARQILREGSEMPYCVFPVNWDDAYGALFPHLSHFRNAARLNAAYALLLAKDGETDEALDWCAINLRLSEHAATEPTLIAQLVSYAIRTITFKAMRDVVSDADVRPEIARELDRYLSGIDLQNPLDAALNGERAIGCDTYELIRRDPQQAWDIFTDISGGPASSARWYASPLARPLLRRDQVEYLVYMRKQRDLVSAPYRTAVNQLHALEADVSSYPIAGTIISAFYTISRKRDQATAEIGLCRVVLALKAYKAERGQYPARLDELQQTLDYELPEDPFTGKLFIYQPQGDGFKFYSYGGDLDDDGGASLRDEGHNVDDCDMVWECVR